MISTPVDELKSLGRKFDIFRGSPPPTPALIRDGLIPPLPIWNNELVWGFPHIDAAVSLGIGELHTVAIEGTATEVVCAALDLEGRLDGYEITEFSALLALLNDLDIDPSESSILSRVQASGSFVPKARQFASLTPVLRNLVAARRLDLKSAARSRLEDDVWALIADIPGLTVSTLRIVARDLDEIVRRDNLDSETVKSIVLDAVGSADPTKAIRRRRYPMLTSMEDRFVACRDRYLRGSGAKLKAPEYFEGDAYSVSFSFRSREELSERIAALSRLQEGTDELFDLL